MNPESERIANQRRLFARQVSGNVGISPGSELEAAFASTPRELFVGPPPWKIFTPAGYMETASGDPSILYQDVVVSLGTPAPLNNGQPTLHACCIHALGLKQGEHVLHIGAGTGYYTTILAKLVGPAGCVDAYEIEPELAIRARRNLAQMDQVRVHCRSGSAPPLPECDAIYVNAGASDPLPVWLDALRPLGRLLFPLTPASGNGGMLLVTRQDAATFAARFLMQVQFVGCAGARDEATGRKLNKAFRGRSWEEVKSLHRDDAADKSCWCSGDGWWLSTR